MVWLVLYMVTSSSTSDALFGVVCKTSIMYFSSYYLVGAVVLWDLWGAGLCLILHGLLKFFV